MTFNLAVDVHYHDDGHAVAAGVAFVDWSSEAIVQTEVVHIADVQSYEPGNFYKRELPCLLTLLARFALPPRTIIIDGYVTLGLDQRDGLGARLFSALKGEIPVIGVAKSRFADTPVEHEVLRGSSAQPLYVTSRGIALDEAKKLVRDMHGRNRLPSLLVAVDHACRGIT